MKRKKLNQKKTSSWLGLEPTKLITLEQGIISRIEAYYIEFILVEQLKKVHVKTKYASSKMSSSHYTIGLHGAMQIINHNKRKLYRLKK